MGNGRRLEPQKMGLDRRSIAHDETAGTGALRAAHGFPSKNPNKTHARAARIFFPIGKKTNTDL